MSIALAKPVAAVARRRIEDALLLWVAETTGLGVDRVIWTSASEIARASFPFATMAWTSTILEGTDWLATEDLGDTAADVPDVRLHARGPRRCTITVQVYDDAHAGMSPEASPVARLDAAVARLSLPTTRGRVIDAGFGVVSASSVREIAPGQVAVELVGYIESSVAEDVFSIQHIGLVPDGDLESMPPFTTPDDGLPTPPETFVVRYGVSASVVDTEAEVLGLASALTVGVSVESIVLPFDAASLQFCWVFIPAPLELSRFEVGGFVGGFILSTSIVVGGQAGTLWRSAYSGLGSFNVEIS
jgi:hypothetical protein